eukprot:TRINITY_DN106418_c0_g1_i1.p1 TRINITY_DN106418_c0_g1~~TRINITY_DN106418_c0_g1_i1.p1  ORF type:complete len:495 (-),score=60.02 TRINITY_DN106418_c0_g1_i1:74-1558(-)
MAPERRAQARTSSPAPVAKAGDDTKKPEVSKLSPGFWEGFAGTVGGSFFRAPLWVDEKKSPGMTSQEDAVRAQQGWKLLRQYLTGSALFFSPNLVWLSVALFDYFVFPYDIPAATSWSMDWISYRLLANSVITFGYVGFWHLTLYILGWGKRPFNPDRQYKISKVAHNAFYNVLGVVQWTAWEAIAMHCWATGRLPYIPDSDSFGTWWGFAAFVAACFGVALWRDLHFYFAHRFIHIKFLYKYVHSLHHRNTDIEPFAGLSMHPIEHLFYFACAGPALYMKASPFAFMWFGVHLLISPAASHSGFEDNFQSDQFHYLHHRYFECNYGTGGVPYDLWFGTFRESLDVRSKTYKGTHVESADVKMDSKSAAQADAKATLLGMPKWDEAVYNLVTYVMFPLIIWNARSTPTYASSLALLMSLGPSVVGMLLLALTSRRAFANPRLTFLYPFHKERLLGAFGINVLISLIVTVMPVYHLVHYLVSEPGQGVYFKVYAR